MARFEKYGPVIRMKHPRWGWLGLSSFYRFSPEAEWDESQRMMEDLIAELRAENDTLRKKLNMEVGVI